VTNFSSVNDQFVSEQTGNNSSIEQVALPALKKTSEDYLRYKTSKAKEDKKEVSKQSSSKKITSFNKLSNSDSFVDEDKKAYEQSVVLSKILDENGNPFYKSTCKGYVGLYLDVGQNKHIKSKNTNLKSQIFYLSKSYAEYAKFLKLIVDNKSLRWFVKNVSANNDEMEKLAAEVNGKSLYEIMVTLLEKKMQNVEIKKMQAEMSKESFKELWKKITADFQGIEQRQQHGSSIDAHKMNSKQTINAKSEAEKYFEELFTKKGLGIDFYFLQQNEDFCVHYYEGG